jgi:hypothetical protein
MEMACSDGVGPEQDIVTRAAARTHAPLAFGKQTRCRSIDSLQVLETEWNHHQRPAGEAGRPRGGVDVAVADCADASMTATWESPRVGGMVATMVTGLRPPAYCRHPAAIDSRP